MNWKALVQFGEKKQSGQPPIISFLIGFGLLAGLVPWLLMNGKFLLKRDDFRPEEILLTVNEQPVFFWILAFFSTICGAISLVSGVQSYRVNVRAQNPCKRRPQKEGEQ